MITIPDNIDSKYRFVILSALRARQINGCLLASLLNPSDLAYLEQRADLNLTKLHGRDLTLIYLNLRLAVFQDRRLRQALYYAIDRKAITDQLLSGQATKSDSPLPEGSWAYVPTLGRYSFNANLATLLLDEAGWRLGAQGHRLKGNETLAFTLVTNNDPLRLALAEEIASRWRAIGVAVTVAREHDASARRGAPARVHIGSRCCRETSLAASVGAHDVDVVVAAAVALERDPSPVTRPGRILVGCGVRRQPCELAPVRIRAVDLEVAVAGARPRDLAVVARESRARSAGQGEGRREQHDRQR